MITLIVKLFLVFNLFNFLSCTTLDDIDSSDFPVIVEARGFTCETHYITTSDGYILGTFRIVNPFASKYIDGPLKPVLIQSGFLGSSVDFIINSPQGFINESILANYKDLDSIDFETDGQDLGFILANLGYDVWMTNPRGNYYSTNHTTLSPETDASDFWSFSIDEMALLDLPAIMDYVEDKTGQSSFAYIGYSRGSMVMFALMADKPEYAEKIKPFIAIAPPVYLLNNDGPLKILAEQQFILNFIRDHPASCFGTAVTDVVKICNNIIIKPFCDELEVKVLNIDSQTTNDTRIDVYLSHLPAGAPCWDLIHFAQRMTKQEFTKIDLGSDYNLKRYGTETAPKYNLAGIKNNDIIIFQSTGDDRADPTDVQRLIDELQVSLADRIIIENDEFSHLDFFLENDVASYVNKPVAKILDKYRST